jgi:hypothetical protein
VLRRGSVTKKCQNLNKQGERFRIVAKFKIWKSVGNLWSFIKLLHLPENLTQNRTAKSAIHPDFYFNFWNTCIYPM